MNPSTDNTYAQQMLCSNCGNHFIKRFEKGSTCSGSYSCPNCGCREARATGLPEVAQYGAGYS